MSAVTNIWSQLVQRRLWPVAIILIAGLAAVPLTMAKEPEAQPPIPVAQADEDNILATTPIVSMATAEDRAKRRLVLGEKKNPFAVVEEPAAVAPETPAASSSGAQRSTASTPADTGATGSTGGTGAVPGSGSTPVTTDPGTATPVPAPKTYDKYDLTVRFGDSSGALSRMTLKRLQPLPKSELPALIYLGIDGDGKTAIFLVEQGVLPVGDGACRPTPDACETLRLKAGETEFLDVTDETGTVTAQYQLDLVKVHRSSTTSASRASASSKAGRLLVAGRADGPLPYRFDAASGTLERRPGVVGDVARAAAGLR